MGGHSGNATGGDRARLKTREDVAQRLLERNARAPSRQADGSDVASPLISAGSSARTSDWSISMSWRHAGQRAQTLDQPSRPVTTLAGSDVDDREAIAQRRLGRRPRRATGRRRRRRGRPSGRGATSTLPAGIDVAWPLFTAITRWAMAGTTKTGRCPGPGVVERSRHDDREAVASRGLGRHSLLGHLGQRVRTVRRERCILAQRQDPRVAACRRRPPSSSRGRAAGCRPRAEPRTAPPCRRRSRERPRPGP